MTMQKNRQLIAIPNVLRDQTAPNSLGGLRPPPARAVRPRLRLRAIAFFAAGVLALTLVLMGRGA